MNRSRDEQRLDWCLDCMVILLALEGGLKRAFSDLTVAPLLSIGAEQGLKNSHETHDGCGN